MPTCFVIQPFDSDRFDKRFDDIYKPALEQAGLEPYRVDRDAGVEVPIDSIEDKIRKATICLADITTNNANVWYELGYAMAKDRSVIMVCSDEREGRLPFDIQHRTVIEYRRDSSSDFEKLRQEITKRTKAIVQQNAARQVIDAQQVAPQAGLSNVEIQVLAIAAAATDVPGSWENMHSLKRDAERSGLTGVGFGVALRRLHQKHLVELREGEDDYGETYRSVALSNNGWNWIDSHESLFSFRKEEDATELSDDDIPF